MPAWTATHLRESMAVLRRPMIAVGDDCSLRTSRPTPRENEAKAEKPKGHFSA
jgi:hypothetical protein